MADPTRSIFEERHERLKRAQAEKTPEAHESTFQRRWKEGARTQPAETPEEHRSVFERRHRKRTLLRPNGIHPDKDAEE